MRLISNIAGAVWLVAFACFIFGVYEPDAFVIGTAMLVTALVSFNEGGR